MDFPLQQAISNRRTRRDFARGEPIGLDVLERLVVAMQGGTDDLGNRSAPSAHALHPLCLFVAVGDVDGLERGLYSINAMTMAFERMHGNDLRADLMRAAVDDQAWIEKASCIVSVCADLVTPSRDFADQPPFGTRGLRYVYIEAGAAAQNGHLQAVAEGVGCALVGGFDDAATASVLGLQTPLAPILHLCFGPIERVRCEDAEYVFTAQPLALGR